MLITFCHTVNCQHAFLYSLPSGRKTYFDDKLAKYIFYGFCGNNSLIRYGKLNFSWACTAVWQASCFLPRGFLRTVVLNPNCFHCSQAPSPTPAVPFLADDLTTYLTAKTRGHVKSLISLLSSKCTMHGAFACTLPQPFHLKQGHVFLFPCQAYVLYLDT